MSCYVSSLFGTASSGMISGPTSFLDCGVSMICRLSRGANIRTKKEFLITKPKGNEHIDWRSEAKRVPGDLCCEAIGAPDKDRGGAWHMEQRNPQEFVHLSILDYRWRRVVILQTYSRPFITEEFDQGRLGVELAIFQRSVDLVFSVVGGS